MLTAENRSVSEERSLKTTSSDAYCRAESIGNQANRGGSKEAHLPKREEILPGPGSPSRKVFSVSRNSCLKRR